MLAEVARHLHDQGVPAHRAIKELVPESEGALDAQGLQTLFERVGVKISKQRASRLLASAATKTRLASYELVQLLGDAQQQMGGSEGRED